MREAPAFAGSTGSRPRSNGPRKPKPSASRSGRAVSLVSRAFARPGVTIAGAAFAGVMTVIVANAILFQKGHHPSPLFGPSHVAKALGAPAPAPVQATLPAPQPPEPLPMANSDPATPTAPLQPSKPPLSAVKVKTSSVHAAHHSRSDPIGHLLNLRSGEAGTTKSKQTRSPPFHKSPA